MFVIFPRLFLVFGPRMPEIHVLVRFFINRIMELIIIMRKNNQKIH